MSGSNNVLSGFVQLTRPPTQMELTAITNNSSPVSISFAPRTTPPQLQGNIIIDSTDISTNTCTYKGNVYEMIDVQICSVMNKGYQYPGQNSAPVAELIVTFVPKQMTASANVMNGILLCVPIYDTDTPNHNDYLTQLIDPSMPTCNYTNKEGMKYVGGQYRQGDNSSLVNCVKSCCDDPNCIAYTFNDGQCSLNNVISESVTAPNSTSSAGMINRGAPGDPSTGQKAIRPTLQSVFFNSNVDTSQTSIAYTTTFDTVDGDNRINATKTLFIVVFPVGIHMAPSSYQNLILQMKNYNSSLTTALLPYYAPLRLRDYSNTLLTFTYDKYGNKVVKTTSNKGELSTVQMGGYDEKFKNHFEWFSKPPFVLTKSSSASFNSEKCPYYKTTQYKCMPFNQLHDLSGNPQDAYVIPGNTSLQDILNKKTPSNSAAADNLKTTDDIITYSAGAIVGIVGFYVLYRIGVEIGKNA